MHNLLVRSKLEILALSVASVALDLEHVARSEQSSDEAVSIASRLLFESIGCKDQKQLTALLSRRAEQGVLLRSMGIDRFFDIGQAPLNDWCKKQISPKDSNRIRSLSYCQKEYSKQFRTFLSSLYALENSSSLDRLYSLSSNNKTVSPSCLLSKKSKKMILNGYWLKATPASLNANKIGTEVLPLPANPNDTKRVAEQEPGLGERFLDQTQKSLGLSGEYRGFYENRFRNQKCPAWKKYVDMILDPETILKKSAEKCGLPNKVTLDVVGAITPQGGYKLAGTGVNTIIHLGQAREYSLGKSKLGAVICAHGDVDCLKKNKAAIVNPSYCSGATYTAFVGTLNVLSPEIFSVMTSKQLDNFRPGLVDNHGLYGLINNSGDGVRDAAKAMARFGERYAFAKVVDTSHSLRSFANLCAGDYIQWDRKQQKEIPENDFVKGFQANGSGHSGVFLGVENNNEGQSMAYFWSSNGGTHGYGVTCEPIAHMTPKAVRVINPKSLVHIPEYRHQAYLEGDLMNMDIDERLPIGPAPKAISISRATEI